MLYRGHACQPLLLLRGVVTVWVFEEYRESHVEQAAHSAQEKCDARRAFGTHLDRTVRSNDMVDEARFEINHAHRGAGVEQRETEHVLCM